jgi:hypothetical protein
MESSQGEGGPSNTHIHTLGTSSYKHSGDISCISRGLAFEALTRGYRTALRAAPLTRPLHIAPANRSATYLRRVSYGPLHLSF